MSKFTVLIIMNVFHSLLILSLTVLLSLLIRKKMIEKNYNSYKIIAFLRKTYNVKWSVPIHISCIFFSIVQYFLIKICFFSNNILKFIIIIYKVA